jgi:hypothetical protein
MPAADPATDDLPAAPDAAITRSPSDASSGPAFAHASEAELARILDYYQVVWQYEPRTFPILFNLEGAVVESFAPDFYLPEFDLYVELTTLKQSLVRKKNRKLRRLRELYPDVRIKLFYARDFKALLLKYGRFQLADSLSGGEGQARPLASPSIEDGLDVEPPAQADETPASERAGVASAARESLVASGSRRTHNRRARRRRRVLTAG